MGPLQVNIEDWWVVILVVLLILGVLLFLVTRQKRKVKEEGYVYVISNIGSFGPDVYKIGVTRREHPMERIEELYNASVPFPFDVHALVYSPDAYDLEAKIHRDLDEYRLNKVNKKKEFFHVPLEVVEEAFCQYEPEAEFVYEIEAKDYTLSLEREKYVNF